MVIVTPELAGELLREMRAQRRREARAHAFCPRCKRRVVRTYRRSGRRGSRSPLGAHPTGEHTQRQVDYVREPGARFAQVKVETVEVLECACE